MFCCLEQADALNTLTLSLKRILPLPLAANTPNSSLSLLSTTAHSSLETMVNFAVNPKPFVPSAMVIKDGGPLR
jgi:hypothetical protein